MSDLDRRVERLVGAMGESPITRVATEAERALLVRSNTSRHDRAILQSAVDRLRIAVENVAGRVVCLKKLLKTVMAEIRLDRLVYEFCGLLEEAVRRITGAEKLEHSAG